MKSVCLTLLVLSLVVVACGGAAAEPSPSPSPTPGSLLGRSFLSTSVTRDGAAFALVPNTQIRLNFNATGELGASAGCNSMSGTYTLAGNVLVLQGLGMTEMACDPPALMAQDEWLAALLGGRPTLALEGDTLTIAWQNFELELLDREVAQPDLQLLGPIWTVDSIVTGDAVSSVPQGVTATIRFNADGSVDIDTGCNSGGGRVTQDGTTLQFLDIATTRRGCAGAAGELETAVLAVVGAGAVDFQVDANSLTLRAGQNGLVLRGAP